MTRSTALLVARCALGAALAGLAVHRAATAWVYSGAETAAEPARRLEVKLPAAAAFAPTCAASQDFPVRGVQYVPHLVGEPYPHPESKPWGHYEEAYSTMHRRDLPLIGGRVGADTLALRPWPTDGDLDLRAGFFEEMRNAGICKVIPTFHAAKYFADMLRQGLDIPETDPSSALAVDFTRFGSSVRQEFLGDITMVGWTIDLSLDLYELLPLVGGDCGSSIITRDKSFQRYTKLLNAIQRWVHPSSDMIKSVAPYLKAKPFLLPLDLSRISWYEPAFQQKLTTFMSCMGRDVTEGGWSSAFSSGAGTSAKWLLSFGQPLHARGVHDRSFLNLLHNISATLRQRAVVMVGTQALANGILNPINSVNLQEDFEVDNERYQTPFDDYMAVQSEFGNLDGFVYDEWMDDWDRGTRGPFFVAAKTLDEMKDNCPNGGRFHHDIQGCSRAVASDGLVFPEFFGLVGSSSRFLQHCIHPRFSQRLFDGPESNATETIGMRCEYMVPDSMWMTVALSLMASVLAVQFLRMVLKWCFKEGVSKRKQPRRETEESHSEREARTGYVEIRPQDAELCGGHNFEVCSTRFRSDEEAAWWIWTHASSQMAILERQVHVEQKATRALKTRKQLRPPTMKSWISSRSFSSHAVGGESDSDDGGSSDLARAMQVVHRRTLEGFASWCTYISNAGLTSVCHQGLYMQDLRSFARSIEENSDRPTSLLFAEALLLRTLESMGEQMISCPERLSYLLFKILLEADGDEETGHTTFSVDMDKLHDGLLQMNVHSNPYTREKMPNGKWELGLNFDDINECGIQCRDKVTKTYKEPSSIMVLIDLMLCYRVPFMIKMYSFAIAGYIYLGSRMGDDITTSHNGSLWEPKWLRINYIQYTALVDAAIWTALEVLLVIYVSWQRGPSLGYRSPGIPGLKWFLEHMFNLCISAFGGLWVYSEQQFSRKPWECAQSDLGDPGLNQCVDERTHNLWGVLQYALMYWACRMIVFALMNLKHMPIFIFGTPARKARAESGRGCWARIGLDLRVTLAWAAILGVCVCIEVLMLLPSMKGLDWTTTCGMDLLGGIAGLPKDQGVCSQSTQVFTFKCVTCLSSVLAGWMLVFLGVLIDVYFVVYIAAALVGGFMGHKRELNDLKNTTMPVDLREGKGREALLFERTFGPGWQQIWRVMVKGLSQESLISPKQAIGLVHAAGISMDSEPHVDKAQKPIHLTRFPSLAAERLAFFFQSLKWIESNKETGRTFDTSTDALTGDDFDVGSIPSLTQIIPAYNEVVIPAADFLKAGADPEDAKNGSPDDQPGLGDLTLPPQGDGVNTNLAFMISQFPDEWCFLAKRLHAEGLIETGESQDLYHSFMKDRLRPESVKEIRLWACLRMQSVAKTVIGALQYGRALASLPKIREHYAQYPDKRIPEDHVEVILAHQTYGHTEGSEKNDQAVQLLLERYADDPLYLVFDLKKGSSAELWRMVESFLASRGGYTPGSFEQASIKCRWDKARHGLRVLEVLPRKFSLRLGQGDFKTQGKACNQLNGLRFATGHYVQALDCNMGTFIGEGFKVPYVLRMFMPLDKEDRTVPRCRYLGFREYIYTGREGAVGKCHAAAEWTFGTIYQRFLSGMGMRMHYGHPDFLDGFWARNRGGMSKSSPVVNLSEDIFAGYNVRMREEASPHIDALEFEKGREATFNAASNFFSKISGGSVAVLRSRDNHLLCERIGLVHSLSFYFTSVAFYTSNLLVDVSIYLYVVLFILFTLAGLGPGQLAALGSTFSQEWIVAMGLVTLVPQLVEMVLEHGAMRAFREVFGGFLSATFFFIFQNKNIASSMKEGAMTGIARYFFTGRPQANQHQTWKDIYVSYWKSHYKPAFFVLSAYCIYRMLAAQSYGEGRLPMILVMLSCTSWLITPVVFSPFPRWNLIRQDLHEFNGFITGGAGTVEADIPDVVARGKKGTVRSLYECGLADEMSVWTESQLFMLVLSVLVKVAVAFLLLIALPAEILDFLPIFVVALSFTWVVVLGYFLAGLNNIFLVMSFLVWPATALLAHHVIGDRFGHPDVWTRMPEYTISMALFLFLLGIAKDLVLVTCRCINSLLSCLSRKGATGRMHECIRVCFVYFFVHQLQFIEAYIVLFLNLLVASALAAVDKFFCNSHTWLLLNSEMARTKHGERYMEKNATFYEQDYTGHGLDLWASDSEFEGTPRQEHEASDMGSLA